MATMTAPPVTPKKRFSSQSLQQSIANYPGAWLLIVTYLGAFLYLMDRSHWNATFFQNINATNIVGYVTPLIVASAFIERAVEVVISPLRDKEGDRKQNTVTIASNKIAAASGDPQAAADLEDATDDLAQYTGQTRRFAFTLAVAFSVMAVTAGVRVLWPMLDTTKLQNIPVDQQNYFRWYDMLLSTLLLAGGAAGIHAPISAITGFFQKNS